MIEPFTLVEDEYMNLLNHHVSRGKLITAQIGDIHLGAINPKVQYDIIKSQIIDELYKLPKLDILSLPGDFFDHKVQNGSDVSMYASILMGEFVNLCKSKDGTLVIIEGTDSHDARQIRSFSNYILDPTIDFRIVENIQFEYIKGAKVLCIPELYGLDENIYSQYLYYSDEYDMCFMHGTIHGAVYGDTVGNGRLFHIEDFCNCRGPIFAGHVHKPGCFDKHFYYTGTPIRYKHGEEEPKGFLITIQDLDSGYYDCYFKEVKSFKYITLHMSELVSNDPRDIIDYINNKKEKESIDNIRIIFDLPVPDMTKSVINNFYRNSKDVSIKYSYIEKERLAKEQADVKEAEEYDFILNDKLTDEEKFVMFCNYKKGEEFITVKELEDILSGIF